jgi:plastocyanin
VTRRLALLAVAALVVAAPAAGSRGHDMLVSAREYTFQLSRDHIASGKVSIEMDNFGQDPHSLAIKKVHGGKIVASFGTVLPGTQSTFTTKLGPGTYELYCSIANHEALGMKAFLTVKATSPPPDS